MEKQWCRNESVSEKSTHSFDENLSIHCCNDIILWSPNEKHFCSAILFFRELPFIQVNKNKLRMHDGKHVNSIVQTEISIDEKRGINFFLIRVWIWAKG